MGLGGISPWQLLIILLIVVLIFGTKKLRGMGGDLGGAVKSFRKAMDDKVEDEEAPRLEADPEEPAAQARTEQKVDSSG